MEIVIGYALFNLVACIVIFKRYKENNIIKYIYSIWTISSFASILYYIESFKYTRITILPYIFLFTCLIISLIPFFSFKERKLTKVEIGNKWIFKRVIYCIIIISILPFLENVIHLISSMNNSTQIAEIYDEKMSGEIDNSKLITWHTSIGKICNSINLKFAYCSIFILFTYLANFRFNKYVGIGLAIVCINPILHSIGVSSRAGIVFTCLNSVFYYFLFRNILPSSIRKNIKKGGVILISLAIFSFFIVTISRYFSNEAYQNVSFWAWLSLYLGEGTLNFNDTMWYTKAYMAGDNCFSFFKNIFGLDTFTDLLERRAYWEIRTGVQGNLFYTFIGDIFSDIGYFVMPFLMFISLYIRKQVRNKASIRILPLYMFSIWATVCIGGFTCYIFKSVSGTIDILFSLFIIFILNYRFNHAQQKG